MSTFEHLSLKKLPSVPWKNGGGTTREIACSPHGATMADFDWRVSVADVNSDGAFSHFENIERTIVLLDGAGMNLAHPSGAIVHALTTPLAPFTFAGETPFVAKIVNGACQDFNVMTRRGAYAATVEVVTENRLLSIAQNGVLLATRGRWTFQGNELNEGECCVWRDSPPRSAQLVDDLKQGGRALFVSIHRTIAR